MGIQDGFLFMVNRPATGILIDQLAGIQPIDRPIYPHPGTTPPGAGASSRGGASGARRREWRDRRGGADEEGTEGREEQELRPVL